MSSISGIGFSSLKKNSFNIYEISVILCGFCTIIGRGRIIDPVISGCNFNAAVFIMDMCDARIHMPL